MLRCYSATLANVRYPLKNRKYITYKYISIYVGEWGCFLSVCATSAQHTGHDTHDQRERRKKPLKFAF